MKIVISTVVCVFCIVFCESQSLDAVADKIKQSLADELEKIVKEHYSGEDVNENFDIKSVHSTDNISVSGSDLSVDMNLSVPYFDDSLSSKDFSDQQSKVEEVIKDAFDNNLKESGLLKDGNDSNCDVTIEAKDGHLNAVAKYSTNNIDTDMLSKEQQNANNSMLSSIAESMQNSPLVDLGIETI